MSRTLLTINDLSWSGMYALPSNGTATTGGPGTTSYSCGALAVRYVSGQRRFLMPTYADQNTTTGQTWGDLVEWRVPATAPYTGATPSAAPEMVEVRRWANWTPTFAATNTWWSGVNGVRLGGIYWDEATGVLWYEAYGYYDGKNHPFLAGVQLLDTVVSGNYRAVGTSYGPFWYRDGNPSDASNLFWKQACNWIIAVPADQQSALNGKQAIVGAGVGAIGGMGNIGPGFHSIAGFPALNAAPNTVIPLGQRLADYTPESPIARREAKRNGNYTFDNNPANSSGLQPVVSGVGRWQMSLDQINSFIWVETTTKEGILLFGRQATGYTWYGFNPRSTDPAYNTVGPDERDPTRTAPSGNGYGSSAWSGALYIFDPAQVREVAAGTRSPYSDGIDPTSVDWKAAFQNLPLSTYEQVGLGTPQSRPISSIISNGGFWDAIAQEIIWVQPTVIGGARPVINLFTIGASTPALAITTGALVSGVQGTAYTQALNGANGTLPYSWGATGLPTGLSVVGSNITGTPSQNGTFSVALTLTDAVAATAHATLPLVIAATTPPPTPPTITTSTLNSGTVGTSYTTSLSGINGTPPYTWSATGLPTGLSVSGATIVGTPTISGTFSVTITLTDSASPTHLVATKVLPLAIAAVTPPSPPRITSTSPLAAGIVGSAYLVTLTEEGGTAPFTWAVASGLPPGLAVSGAAITGTPTTAGVYSFTVSLTDSASPTPSVVTAPFSITITAIPALTITTTSPLTSGTVGVAYSATLANTNGTAPFTWSVASGLPPGLAVSGATIVGTPTTAGAFSFTLQVTDSASPTPAVATKAMSITIAAAPALTIVTSALPSGTVGVAYSVSLVGINGTTPYTWGASGLPSGLAVSGSTITGAPAQSGTFSVTLTLTDSASPTPNVTTKGMALSIAAAPLPPPPLTITTTSCPAGVVDTAYFAPLTGVNGTPPYIWSATGLPPGLAILAATIVGTPTLAGVYQFTLTLTDSTSPTPNVVTAGLSITVTDVEPTPPPPVDLTVQSATVTAVEWQILVTDVPPDAFGVWAVQFYKNTGVKLGIKDATAPYLRSTLVPAGTYRVSADWTQTGQTTITRSPTVVVVSPGQAAVITPSPLTVQSVTVSPVKWELKIVDVPPDETGGWSVQFYRNPGVKVGKMDSTSPYARSVTIGAGTYQIYAVWTKSGQATVTRTAITQVLP